ncbi:DUF4834 family protein [Sphingobacterium sp. SGG-5]|uniref:DUF4834 family protein n=1 Tax=Sphingobacterium sp. SGG-5 TaxID=2710881 RepID=UPI0013EA3DDB|nr:DUF4834 family protein [Sphingobacterium sp. SGG-5]NGM60456.1 DUF4834 family protein [Sphingobacterium sp. SGG-5]
MSTLIYFILFTVAFYYLFKFTMRLVLPFALRKLTERMMKKAQHTQYTYDGYGQPFGQSHTGNNTQQNSTRSKDGKVRVDYVPPQEEKRKGTATAGEFVDFEEVK